MVYITGDCHGDFSRFTTRNFPAEKEMTKNDIVIICGDFGGVWSNSNEEKYWLKWLDEKPFTTLFVDGNHENFDLLYSYPVVDLFGGKAHKIRDSVYHLMRGYVFTIQGKKFFAFGGASSHDIQDGILDPFAENFRAKYVQWNKQEKMFRVNRISWWKEELPTREEIAFAEETLAENNYEVDYVISHCCPQEIVAFYSSGAYESDILTTWFNQIAHRLKFKGWYFGHYHNDRDFFLAYHMMYYRIERIL